jgi:hypothetical protein
MPRPSARIDIAVINGEICGYEIKSDVDQLSRLSRQIPAFSAVFDKVSVVITSRHLQDARRHVPAWWGIIVASPAPNTVDFRIERKAKSNRASNLSSLLWMLTRKELLDIVAAEHRRGMSKLRQHNLIEAILSALPPVEIRARARSALKKRPPHASYSSSGL